MTKLLRPSFLVALLATVPALAALDVKEWEYRQTIEVPATQSGLSKLALPTKTLALSHTPDWADFRLLDPDGRETPYLIFPDPVGVETTVHPRLVNFVARQNKDSTEIRIDTDAGGPLDFIDLQTRAPVFRKWARIEASLDGIDWKLLTVGLELSRQKGNYVSGPFGGIRSYLSVPLGGIIAPHIRITVDDTGSPPIEFDSANVGGTKTVSTFTEIEETEARLLRREEFAGATILTFDAGAAHLPVTRLEFTVSDPVFAGFVAIVGQQMKDDALVDVGTEWDSIYRLPGAKLKTPEKLSVAMSFFQMKRFRVRISNGTSPPLTIPKLRFFRRPVWLAFAPLTAGTYTLLAGNTTARAPVNDFTSLQYKPDVLQAIVEGTAKLRPIERNPAYATVQPPAEPATPGSVFDPLGWPFRKSITYDGTGFKQLELDAATLAHCQPNVANLRLVQRGRVVPYLIERPALFRAVKSQVKLTPPEANSTGSRWEIALPQGNLPVRRLVLTSSSPAFHRDLHVFELAADADGRSTKRTLAQAKWSRPGDRRMNDPEGITLTINFTIPASQKSIFIEADGPDHTPLILDEVNAFFPVIRLVFKAPEGEAPLLFYGHSNAGRPVFDLIVDPKEVLAADRDTARLGPEEPATDTNSQSGWSFGNPYSKLFLWGALALVVIVGFLTYQHFRFVPSNEDSSPPP